MKIKISPSLLAADFTRLKEEIQQVEVAGADMLHLDIMDGHFVPNITFGPPLVACIRPITKLCLESHLMIENPGNYIESFAKAGSDIIIIHAEATNTIPALLDQIRKYGIKTGISIKPKTRLETILPFFPLLDVILFMTVEPGFGGQTFMPEVLPKIIQARDKIIQENYSIELEVDGGITLETAPQAINAGASILVAGTAIFGRKNQAEIITKMRSFYTKAENS